MSMRADYIAVLDDQRFVRIIGTLPCDGAGKIEKPAKLALLRGELA